MRNSPSVGSGTVLPATATVKNKKPVSKPATTAASTPPRGEKSSANFTDNQDRLRATPRPPEEKHPQKAGVPDHDTPLRVELSFDGSMKHLVAAMAAGDGMTVAERCETLIRDNVFSYLEFEATQADEKARVATRQQTLKASHVAASMQDTTLSPTEKNLADESENVGKTPKSESNDPFTVRLSSQASDLVRWYCKITHHRPQHVVEGIVHGELEAAKEAYENTYGDDAFDIVLGRVLDAQLGSDGAQPALLSGEYGTSVHVSKDALLWLQRARLDAGCPVEDIASATIVRALGSLYKGVQDQATAKSVQDWATWEELNKAARDERDRRIGASNDVADAALA